MIKVLFVGESWFGSCARSVKEALGRHPEVVLDEVNEDLFFPQSSKRWMRAINRLFWNEYRKELLGQIIYRIGIFRPDLVVFYKGNKLTIEDVSRLRQFGCLLVCIYPDMSPHAHGEDHRLAVGAYDLVISTKPFHPSLWNGVYGYTNQCHFVPQGYDPMLHVVHSPPTDTRFDVVMVATYRKQYGELIRLVSDRLNGHGIKFGIGGDGWQDFAIRNDWVISRALTGRSYIEWLRSGKICIAPLTQGGPSTAGIDYPGDVDTTRTYELAAAHCFFIHKKTDYVCKLYDEQHEVPMYVSAEELADKIRYFLSRPDERLRMAAAAHNRAVPRYSLDCRAEDIVILLKRFLGNPAISDGNLSRPYRPTQISAEI